MDKAVQDFLDDCIQNAEAVFSRSDFTEALNDAGIEDSPDSVLSDLIEEGEITEVALKDMTPSEQQVLGFDPDGEDAEQQDEDNRTFRVVYEIEKPKKTGKKHG